MLDLTTQPMGLYGALSAASVFGIFIGSWWRYGMRAYEARRMLDSGEAILVDVDPEAVFASEHVDGARNIPLEDLEARIWQIGSTRRTIVLCGKSALRGFRAASKLRDLGYHVIDLGSSFAQHHA
jgi:rhodanese-related sulfurtransferase